MQLSSIRYAAVQWTQSRQLSWAAGRSVLVKRPAVVKSVVTNIWTRVAVVVEESENLSRDGHFLIMNPFQGLGTLGSSSEALKKQPPQRWSNLRLQAKSQVLELSALNIHKTWLHEHDANATQGPSNQLWGPQSRGPKYQSLGFKYQLRGSNYQSWSNVEF